MQTVDMQQLKAGEVNLGVRISFQRIHLAPKWLTTSIPLLLDLHHGRAVQRRRSHRRRLADDNRELHRQSHRLYTLSPHTLTYTITGQSSDGQAHARPRPNLLLPLRISSRHTSSRRYCSLPPPDPHVRITILHYAHYYPSYRLRIDNKLAQHLQLPPPLMSSRNYATKTKML